MSKLKYLIIHTTATEAGREVTSQEITDWHTSPPPRGRGWSRVGYSELFHLDGWIENLREYNHDDKVDGYEITNGVRGVNGSSRHIVYSGGLIRGVATDTRTVDQFRSLKAYVTVFVARHRSILVAGHNQFSSKACPSFDVPAFCREIGIKESNIYNPNQPNA